MNAAQRAAAGAEYLDRNEPGWWEKINVVDLTMSNCFLCVLGQLDGNYEYAVMDRGLEPRSYELGFTASPYGRWNDLTAAWRAEILKRREQEPTHAGA